MASKAGGASLQRLSVTRSRRTMAVVAASKNVLITGGNTGIGFETAKELCKRGDNVIIACRDDQKAKAAIDKCRYVVACGGSGVLPPLCSSLRTAWRVPHRRTAGA